MSILEGLRFTSSVISERRGRGIMKMGGRGKLVSEGGACHCHML
jgi:hypothetical protein